MTPAKPPAIGFVPSLEILPFFADPLHSSLPLTPIACPSYGRMARDMLTGRLSGGILPWEIFITDILSLPGERAHWAAALFLHPCPTELVLRDHLHRGLYPAKPGATGKLPQRLVIGVESRHSLTRHQLHEWLARQTGTRALDVSFKMLPMDLMIRGLPAEALDGFIAPTPWGLLAQEQGLAKLDSHFLPGKFTQTMVLARRRDPEEAPAIPDIVSRLASARACLTGRSAFKSACARMAASGKPSLSHSILEQAARLHQEPALARDSVPDLQSITRELLQLAHFSALPPQIAANETTARLLLPVT